MAFGFGASTILGFGGSGLGGSGVASATCGSGFASGLGGVCVTCVARVSGATVTSCTAIGMSSSGFGLKSCGSPTKTSTTTARWKIAEKIKLPRLSSYTDVTRSAPQPDPVTASPNPRRADHRWLAFCGGRVPGVSATSETLVKPAALIMLITSSTRP